MRTPSIVSILVIGLLGGLSMMQACGGTNTSGGFQSSSGNGSSGGSGGSGSGSGSGFGQLGLDGGLVGGSGSSSGGAGVACPSGWQCDVSCASGATTSITGTVMDPAGADPLYNIVAFVPTTPLGTLPSGVPTGADACSCSALYQGTPIVYALTDTHGNFTISNAPVGQNIPLVVRYVGKWRKEITVNTTSCAVTSAGKINLPSKVVNPGDSIPDIAVSTGFADSLECLLVRIGLDPSEYVPGWTQPGHVHIFNGGTPGTTIVGVAVPGTQEANPMPNAPVSSAGLWDSTADLMKNDIVLLSCEGSPTNAPSPQNLEDYLNAGGRAFASHYHYAWFTGPGGPADCAQLSPTGPPAWAPAGWGRTSWGERS